jgi:hypothetical protein
MDQTSIAWKPDGEHVAIGLFNKAIMTFYVGDLRRSVEAGVGVGQVGEGEIGGDNEKEKEKKDGDGDVLMK